MSLMDNNNGMVMAAMETALDTEEMDCSGSSFCSSLQQ